MPTRDLSAVILDAGRAAWVVAISPARGGARQSIALNRRLDRAKRLAHLVTARYPECYVTAHPLHKDCRITNVAEIRLLVNTTSVGL